MKEADIVEVSKKKKVTKEGGNGGKTPPIVDPEVIPSEKEIEELPESALQELLKAPGLNDREKQTLFSRILSIKSRMIKEAAAENTVDAPVLNDIGISQGLMQPNGEFSIFFSEDLLGLFYLIPIDAEISTQGKVSELFADQDDIVPIDEISLDLRLR